MTRKSIRPTTLALLAAFACMAGGCKPSAQSTSTSGKTSSIEKKWELSLGGRVEGSLALSDDGTIIAAGQDGFVYAVDSSGKLQWKTYIGPTMASPAIGPDGAIYIPNNDGSVFALNRSGSKRWVSVVYPGATYGHNAGAIGDGFLYTPSRDGVKALSFSDGRVEWSAGGGSHQWGGVTLLMDGTIVFGARGRLFAVNTHGDTLWQYPPLTNEATARNGGFPPPGSFMSSSGITPGPDRQLLVGEGHDHLSAIGQDATLRWDFKSRGTNLNTASPVIAADGTIYFAHSDHHLYAFDSFGSKKWDVDLHDYDPSTPVLATDGTIFVAGGRDLYAISPTGKVIAKISVGNSVVSSPTLAPDGTIFLVTDTGVLSGYAGGHGGLMDSPWPKFQADLANTGRARTY
jgi:outer membrane protein assembly factor BamB